MANIIEYNGPANPELHPSEIGERALYNEARVTHQMGEEQAQKIRQSGTELAAAAGDIMKQYEHGDVTRTASAFATANGQMHDAATNFLKDPNLDINDPGLADKFMQSQYNPTMQKIRDGVKTQAGMDVFNNHYNEFSQQFSQQFHRDVSTMAGIHADAAINNYVTQQSQLASQNPSALLPMMKTWDSTIKSRLTVRIQQ